MKDLSDVPVFDVVLVEEVLYEAERVGEPGVVRTLFGRVLQ